MDKKNKLLISIVFLSFLSLSFYYFRDRLFTEDSSFSYRQLAKKTGKEREEEPGSEGKLVSSDRAEKFFVSGGGEPPVFYKELVADPFEVEEGEEQTFSVWAKGPAGIERVTASVETDQDPHLIEMERKEGPAQEGRWQGSWTVSQVSPGSIYQVTFKAFDSQGEEAKLSFSWKTRE